MRTFNCEHCQALLFFENSQCLSCGHPLAYLPDRRAVCAIEPAGNAGDGDAATLWRRAGAGEGAPRYRLCRNYSAEGVCNCAVAEADAEPYCTACRITDLVPDLTVPGNRHRWRALEVAKRRLLYTLDALVLCTAADAALGMPEMRFRFLADVPGQSSALTGHQEGVVTINIAEADEDERARRRANLDEPFRTLLGHFRHESGHYFWDRLIRYSPREDAFRALFGDEREAYPDALTRHYAQGAPADWAQRHVSAYAAAHPWEDWAETWAHYLHMVDALETASGYGVQLDPRRPALPMLAQVSDPVRDAPGFDEMLQSWHSLTFLLNSLNRGLGLADAYPFALTPLVIDKLRFVHDTARGTPAPMQAPPLNACVTA